MVHRLLVYYVIYRKNPIVSLVRVRSKPVIWFFFRRWQLYLIVLPVLMHAVHLVLFLLMFFFIPDHQNMLLSASISFEPGCPNCSASTTCLFYSSGTTILSPANSKPNHSLVSLRTKKILRELLLFVCF